MATSRIEHETAANNVMVRLLGRFAQGTVINGVGHGEPAGGRPADGIRIGPDLRKFRQPTDMICRENIVWIFVYMVDRQPMVAQWQFVSYLFGMVCQTGVAVRTVPTGDVLVVHQPFGAPTSEKHHAFPWCLQPRQIDPRRQRAVNVTVERVRHFV